MQVFHLVFSMAQSCSSCNCWFVVGGDEGAPGFAQGYTVELGFLLYSHGKPNGKNHLPPLILGIPELEIFTGFEFLVALGYSAFGVYVVNCSSFKWTLVERFGICLGRGCTITCNGSIAHSLALTF